CARYQGDSLYYFDYW
nr:immunoglobulin heavy chain junction region [Macaca mulatta]MOX62969.1 immunoglobulin heavy chain junction region [Macaca mulatta]MOX63352.1 immunoglobulin heavy chain junction region [Macaca mulatta]MOX63967.1 immunoglobulin heavy chain junction region [Macaca mulatta]MOX64049.1 immunoglobulin heavy chain junction region [Macaca mulatta]